jgi:hypothetical protein
MTRDTVTLRVCADCMLSRECEPVEDSDREPWGLLEPDDYRNLARGLLWSQHDTPAECEASSIGCECERWDFSWNRCEGCGSTLGGERYAYTLDVSAS